MAAPAQTAASPSAAACAAPLTSSDHSGVLVVGGGVMGLSVALQLLRVGYKHVSIIAEKFSPDTTSDGAGASLRPGGDYTPWSAARDLQQRWGEETSAFLFGLRKEHGAKKTGITLASGYEFWDGPREYPFWRGQVFGMRDVPAEEMRAIGYSAPYAWFYTTGIVDVSCYLNWLTAEVQSLGGQLVKAKVDSLTRLRVATAQWNRAHASADLAAAIAALQSNAADLVPLPSPIQSLLQARPHSFVVNCAGLGSKWIVPDPQVMAAKGCVLRVKCPGLTHFYTNLPHGGYIIPRRDDVVLGGSMVLADYSTDVPAAFREHILDCAAEIIPEVREAEVTLEWAGLRPYRESVRLDLVTGPEPAASFPAAKLFSVGEALRFKEAFGSKLTEEAVQAMKDEEAARLAARSAKEVEWESAQMDASSLVPLIHNYGHSGSGITLHWGCALEVAKIAVQICPPTTATQAKSSS